MKDVWRRLKRNKLAMISLVFLLFLFFIALFASFIMPYNYASMNASIRLQSPNSEHWFGTDNFGRDIFSRVLFGAKYTLIIGFGCTTAAAIGGVILGSIAGYYEKLNNIIMRFIDIIMGIPVFMMALSIIVALGANMRNMIIALAITNIPAFARITRAQVLGIKQQEYIEAARSIGASNLRILTRHILPNAFPPILIQFTLGTVSVILWGASLSFIGQGVQPPTPEWGLMISAARSYLREYPYMSIIPGLAIVVTTYALNLLGDGLRDALDPRLKQ
ncbi:MAG TPA: ABC transporter permease [Synergistales bacterium]|nr:ABC transporter permease [Synergistales bacterium]